MREGRGYLERIPVALVRSGPPVGRSPRSGRDLPPAPRSTPHSELLSPTVGSPRLMLGRPSDLAAIQRSSEVLHSTTTPHTRVRGRSTSTAPRRGNLRAHPTPTSVDTLVPGLYRCGVSGASAVGHVVGLRAAQLWSWASRTPQGRYCSSLASRHCERSFMDESPAAPHLHRNHLVIFNINPI